MPLWYSSTPQPPGVLPEPPEHGVDLAMLPPQVRRDLPPGQPRVLPRDFHYLRVQGGGRVNTPQATATGG